MSEALKISVDWSEWRQFPDPREMGVLHAPYGFGAYQLKNVATDELVLFGIGKNCAYRMSSLLPVPFGRGTRNNIGKREYVLENIKKIQYRTKAFQDEETMKEFEKTLKSKKEHLFNT